MIIVRSPLRITLGGGGTDLPSYSRAHGGLLAAAAIDKYVTVVLHPNFRPGYILKYSQLETADAADAVRHPILREALRLTGLPPAYEIASMADIPAGTGLGSSGSFTTALLKAIRTEQRQPLTPHELAEEACRVEIDRLGEPVGKQDPFIAAYGGLTVFEFRPDDTVAARPLRIDARTLADLEDGLSLFFTGVTRSAGGVLKEQDTRSRAGDPAMAETLHAVKELGRRSIDALESGDLADFAATMHEHWTRKRARGGMSNSQIDAWYELARRHGALGGKLIGAGGGGFLMFLSDGKTALRRAMTDAGLREVRVRFDFEGTRVIVT
jgi:D-glycero-alpha-D-manno-heptose-7-phosphate kinase